MLGQGCTVCGHDEAPGCQPERRVSLASIIGVLVLHREHLRR